MKNLLLILLFFSTSAFPQYNGRNFSISLYGAYTTTARIFLHPNSSDVVLRNNSFIIEDIFSSAAEIRYRITEEIILGINTDYMTTTTSGSRIIVFSQGSTVAIPVEDGFQFIPAEFSVYYLMPFSTAGFKFTMGAGLGYYFGKHIRKITDVDVESSRREDSYGIHVSIGMDYLLKENISLRTGMKFRDPQFTVSNRYTKNAFTYRGVSYQLAQKEFDSKINIDGVTFLLGIVYHF